MAPTAKDPATPIQVPQTKGTRQSKKKVNYPALHPDGTSSSPPGPSTLRPAIGQPSTAQRASSAPSKQSRKEGPEDLTASHEECEYLTPTKQPQNSRKRAKTAGTTEKARASAPSLLITDPPSCQNLSRPDVKQRSVSAPLPKKAEKLNIDREIVLLLKEAKLPKDDSPKYNYVFVDQVINKAGSIYKIGVSVDPKERRKYLRTKCGYDLSEPSRINLQPIKYYAKVEKLCHMELRSFFHGDSCPGYGRSCDVRNHIEFFRVPNQDIVFEVVTRWYDFCMTEPWAQNGELLPKWEHRLKHRESPSDGCDQKKVVEAWSNFTTPSMLETLGFDASVIFRRLKPFWFQIASFLAILYRCDVSFWAKLGLIVVAGSLFVQTMPYGDTWLFDSLFQAEWYIWLARCQKNMVSKWKSPEENAAGADGEQPSLDEQTENQPHVPNQTRVGEDEADVVQENPDEGEGEEMDYETIQQREVEANAPARMGWGTFGHPIEILDSDDDLEGMRDKDTLPPL